ncbi:MAG: hypothetical protein R6X13_07395, partial [bacterium]
YCEDTTGVAEVPDPSGVEELACRPSIVARGGPVRINACGPVDVIDCAGRVVRAFGVLRRASGVIWDGRDDAGRIVPAGCYLVRCGTAQAAVVVLE